jgi:hypothetical protein
MSNISDVIGDGLVTMYRYNIIRKYPRVSVGGDELARYTSLPLLYRAALWERQGWGIKQVQKN